MVIRDTGDPTGFEPLDINDPSYPTPDQLAKLKGSPVFESRELPDEAGYWPRDYEPDELEEAMAEVRAILGLPPKT